MRLVRYRVTNFRSVKDSGWIEADRVTALIGVNESGKTNLLLPLWKLNPALDGELLPTSDYPKRSFVSIRNAPADFCFISAEFEVGATAQVLAHMTGCPAEHFESVIVSRYFDDHYELEFPSWHATTSISPEAVDRPINQLFAGLSGAASEEGSEIKTTALATAQRLIESAKGVEEWTEVRLAAVVAELSGLQDEATEGSEVEAQLGWAAAELRGLHKTLTAPAPHKREDVKDAVLEVLPAFVYYSNYGNLDSEIYLPHVVANMRRKDLGPKEAAKTRTLRVLFGFVELEPGEILKLGRDFQEVHGRDPSADEAAQITEKKRERSILLQSASAKLTESFKNWWKQGEYRFRFEADGNHFRIWVADSQRPEEVELETRSTGLQWFLSFFLVFLYESQQAHENAILLLDEPGLSLHPLAQKDLSAFFDNLSSTNQILYTTHSPFLVDADRLDRVRKVFVGTGGDTQASPDLRQVGGGKAQAGAAYAVYSALNLNVAESLLLGCTPVVVEGPSDQHYLTLMKALLIASGRIAPTRELVFPPGGGTKTMRITASVLTGRDDRLPVILLDGDVTGARMAKELQTSLYEGEHKKVLLSDTFTGISGSEVEDLIPVDQFADGVDRVLKGADAPFSDQVEAGKPLLPQAEAWAKQQGIELPTGWKVEVAKRVKSAMLVRGFKKVDDACLDRWKLLFDSFDK
jgi:energy-coupling factor transporter ATP-binding protein EcfA2